MNGRYGHLMGLSDFTNTEPTISAIALSDDTPVLNDVVTVTANVVDENEVYLGFRSGSFLPFVKVQTCNWVQHQQVEKRLIPTLGQGQIAMQMLRKIHFYST